MEKFFVIEDMQSFLPNFQIMVSFQLEPAYFDLM